MPQIIQERRNPSIGQRLSAGVGRGLDIGQQLMQAHEQKQQQAQQQKAIEKAFPEAVGMPPEIQKVYIQEQMKQQGKQQSKQQEQQFLNQLFGGGQSQQNAGQQLAGEGQTGQQQGGFDPSQISDADIARATAVNPNIGRALQHQKDVALREQSAKQSREFEERKFKFSQEKEAPEHKRETRISEAQAQADVKYNQELGAAEKSHKLKSESLNRLEQLNIKGVTGKPFEKLLEKAGLINLTSEGRREFAADVKNLITDIRSILGSQFSQFEFQTILNAYPSADFSKEANAAIIKNLQDFQDIRNKEFEVAKKIKKENGGKIPQDFQSMVNERVSDYAASRLPEIKANSQRIMADEYGITPGNILMLDQNGEPLDVPREEVERYQSLGATLP